MATVEFNFEHHINDSLQVGDSVYYCSHEPVGNFNTVDNTNFPSTGIVRLGLCGSMNRVLDLNATPPVLTSIAVDVDPTLSPGDQAALANNVSVGDFIMFSKNTQVNEGSLTGYFAETTFENNSPHVAELFAVSAEISQSSK